MFKQQSKVLHRSEAVSWILAQISGWTASNELPGCSWSKSLFAGQLRTKFTRLIYVDEREFFQNIEPLGVYVYYVEEWATDIDYAIIEDFLVILPRR